MKRLVLFLSLACLLTLCLGGTALAVSAPTVGAIIPASAPNDRDTAVVISGAGFATDLSGAFLPAVTLGTTPLVAVTFVDDTTLTGTVPQGMSPAVYDLTVINPDTGSATLTSAFAVTLPPTVAIIDPASAYNDIDTAVTITGTLFATDATGTVSPNASLSNTASGSVALTNVAFVDSATLTATVPWGMDPGTYDLTVTNPDGGSATLPAAFTVDRGIGHWNGAAMYGGDVGGVQIEPGDPDTLYAAAAGVGVFRSKDAGAHWSHISGSIDEDSVILDPLHPTWLYAFGSDNKLYRSVDEGDTWVLIPAAVPEVGGITYWHFYVSPHHPKVLFMAVSGWNSSALGLRKSTDAGASWHAVTDMKGRSAQLIAFHPTDPDRMVLVTTAGLVFQSTDGGDHWSKLPSPPVGAPANAEQGNLIACNPYRPAEVWISWEESEQTFKSTGDPISGWLDVTPPGVGSVGWFRFIGPDEVCAGEAYTVDGGKTWTGAFGQPISYDPRDPRICYYGDEMYGVMKSTDGGVTWVPSNLGLTAMYCISMAVSPTDPQRVYATFHGWPGVFRSDDGTTSWTYLPRPEESGVLRVSEDPFDPQRLYAVSWDGLWVSTDEGEGWTGLGWNTAPASVPGNSPPACFATDPCHAGHLLVVLHDTAKTVRLYASTDSGVSWRAVSLPSALRGIAEFTNVAFDPGTPGLVYLAAPGKGVYRSKDDGVNWRRIDDPKLPMQAVTNDHAIAIATHPQHVLWLLPEGTGPYASFDGGETWRLVGVPPYSGNVVMFAGGDSTRMYAGSRRGLYFSADAGDVFTRAAGVLGRLRITILAATMASDHMIVYAATTGGEMQAPVASTAAFGQRSAAATASVFVGGGVYRWTVAISRVTLRLGDLTSGSLRLGHAVTASGIVTPQRLVGGKVALSVQRMAAGRWVTVRSVTRTIGAGGAYRWSYWPAKRGVFRLRATIARTSTHTSAKTAWRTFRVR